MSVKSKSQSQQGAVLFIVLAVMSVLILLAANFALTMRRSSGMLVSLTEGVQARYSALSGVQYAIFALQERDKDIRWKNDGRVHELELGDSMIWIAVSSGANKIDINSANKEQFAEVLKNLGVEESAALKIAANILHWRGYGDDGKDTEAATDADYEAAGLKKPAHRRFLVPEEIGSVLGVNGEVYGKLKPIITVYGNARVDALSAPDNVLFALGLKADEIEVLKTARKAYYENDTPIPTDALFNNPYLEISRRSLYYRVSSHALLYGETPSTQYAVISTRREKDGSFSVIENGPLTGSEKTVFLAQVQATQQKATKD